MQTSDPDVAVVKLRSAPFSLESTLGECPTGSLTEGYVYNLHDAQRGRWEVMGKSAFRPAMVQGLHHIHLTYPERPFKSKTLPGEVAHVVHYKYPCWRVLFNSKYQNRAANGDFHYDRRRVDETHPDPGYVRRMSKFTRVKSTEFRDFKRRVDKLPLECNSVSRLASP